MVEDSKLEWVRRVLGVEIGTGQQSPAREKLLPIWTSAKEQADGSITQLQNNLRDRGDDDLDMIAEFGLYGATTGQAVALMAALQDADRQGTAAAYAKVVDAVEEFRDFLDGAPIVSLLETNPFGVKVSLRATLGPALTEIARIAA